MKDFIDGYVQLGTILGVTLVSCFVFIVVVGCVVAVFQGISHASWNAWYEVESRRTKKAADKAERERIINTTVGPKGSMNG